jgi:hypothetical protein
VDVLFYNRIGGLTMIRRLRVDRDDFSIYRDWMKSRGFISATYFSVNGFDLKRMKKLAEAGRINAICCFVGKSVKWYYAENQTELAYLRGEV